MLNQRNFKKESFFIPSKYVGYYRVSTKSQSSLVVREGLKQEGVLKEEEIKDRGLGLQSQRDHVHNYVNNKKGVLIGEFYEVETGTSKKKRVEIYKAIELARTERAILVVAKLDRLARDVEFTAVLYRSGVEFICCDNPDANKLTINILAAIAENEAEMISKRVKDALYIKKKNIEAGIYTNKDGSMMKPINGVYRLGGSKTFTEEMRENSKKKRKENALKNKANVQATEAIVMYREKGMSYQEIANKLNELQYKTRYEKEYKATTVMNLYKRYKIENKEEEDDFDEDKINKIIKELRELDWSYQKIADHLNTSGLKNKRGKEFKLCTVRNYYLINS